MSGISDAFEKAINIGRIGNAMMFAHRSPAQHIPFVLIAGLCAAGITLAIIALLRFYETISRPDIAALITALIVFTAAFLCHWAFKILQKLRSKKNNTIGIKFEQDIKDLLQIMTDGLAEPIKDNPKISVLIAAMIGFFIARGRP